MSANSNSTLSTDSGYLVKALNVPINSNLYESTEVSRKYTNTQLNTINAFADKRSRINSQNGRAYKRERFDVELTR